METRSLWIFFVCIIIMVGWMWLYGPQRSVPTTPSQADVVESLTEVLVKQEPETELEAAEHQDVVLQNNHVSITFTNNRGGGISNMTLRHFYTTTEQIDNYVLFEIDDSGPLFRPLTDSDGCFRTPPDMIQTSPTSLIMRYFCNADSYIQLEYTLKEKYYLDMALTHASPKEFAGKEMAFVFPANIIHREDRHSFNRDQITFESHQKIERRTVDAKKEPNIKVPDSAISWLFFGDRYFGIGAAFQENLRPRISTDTMPLANGYASNIIMQYRVPSAYPDTQPLAINLYAGPKDTDYLKVLGRMHRVVNFGLFSFLAVPIYAFMKFTYNNLISNFGVAIVLLTTLIRLLFLPLSIKGMGNMQAMQKIQPQLKKMREKHKDDRQKLNQETMALFRAHKVNPMGGCLPILIQIPVFFALYAVLSNSVELYHAPFIGWITDLSSKDPYYVLPVLLGVSFLVQNRLTPSAADPTMKKVMMLMPIMFTFMMLNLPSGLTLYIFTSTLLGIAQQLIMNRKFKEQRITSSDRFLKKA